MTPPRPTRGPVAMMGFQTSVHLVPLGAVFVGKQPSMEEKPSPVKSYKENPDESTSTRPTPIDDARLEMTTDPGARAGAALATGGFTRATKAHPAPITPAHRDHRRRRLTIDFVRPATLRVVLPARRIFRLPLFDRSIPPKRRSSLCGARLPLLAGYRAGLRLLRLPGIRSRPAPRLRARRKPRVRGTRCRSSGVSMPSIRR
jgi:hypothetical protein